MQKPTVSKFKTIKQKLLKSKTFKIIRGIILGFFYLLAIFRVSLTAVMLIISFLVLKVGYGQSGDLPVRKDESNIAMRYWYDEQGRLIEELRFEYTTLYHMWPITIIPLA